MAVTRFLISGEWLQQSVYVPRRQSRLRKPWSEAGRHHSVPNIIVTGLGSFEPFLGLSNVDTLEIVFILADRRVELLLELSLRHCEFRLL